MCSAVVDLAAGCVGGTAAILVGQPLDTVKVKLQTSPESHKRGMVDCFRTTLAKEGLLRGLYAGTAPSVAANAGENAVLFMCYGRCQEAVAALASKRSAQDLSRAAPWRRRHRVPWQPSSRASSSVRWSTSSVRCRRGGLTALAV